MALDRAGEALADARAGDLDVVARSEHADRDGLAHVHVRGPAELRQVTVGSDAGLRKVAGLRLGEVLEINRLVRELNPVVPVGVRRAHADDRARARLDHGDRDGPAFVVEELGHAQFLPKNADGHKEGDTPAGPPLRAGVA